MKGWKRFIGIVLGASITACCFAGCGSDGAVQKEPPVLESDQTADGASGEAQKGPSILESDQTADGASGADGQEGKHEPIVVNCFNQLIKEDFINAFQQVYPQVNLQMQKYSGMNGTGYALHSLEHGDIPDIYVSTQNFSKESQEKYLLDLSNQDFVNNYTNALLDSMDVNGSIYMLPSGYQLVGIYYNKTIIEEHHWEVPSSFRELKALSKKIEDAGYQTLGHKMDLDGYPFNYFFNISNTAYLGMPQGMEWKEQFPKGEAKAAGNDGLKKAAEYFKKWVDAGYITSKNMDTEEFYNGGSVFFLCLGLSDYTYTTKEGKEYTFGIMPWLSEDGTDNMLTRNVSMYVGISKSLAEEGNEQKLEDALHFLDFCSTVEGQNALMKGNHNYMLSLNEAKISDGSPYQEIEELIYEGKTVPLLYVGWEQLIIPAAQDIKQLIEKKIDVDGLIEALDDTNDGILCGASEDVFASVQERLTWEQTAQLVAAAQGEAVGADCAIVSLNAMHGTADSNDQGVAWYLYEGDVNTDVINVIRPRSATVSVLEMTGRDIKDMRDAGLDLHGNGDPYTYVLMTKGGKKLEDTKTYKLAVATGDMTEEARARAQETEVSPQAAIRDYMKKLGTVTAGAASNWQP